jgi:hypothetical protein
MFIALEIREIADLLEHLRGKVLRLVDEDDRERLERSQRQQKLFQRDRQLGQRGFGQPPASETRAREITPKSISTVFRSSSIVTNESRHPAR